MPVETASRTDLLSRESLRNALAALVEHAPVGMCVLDRGGRFLFINAALARMNGIPAEEHIGRHVAEIVPDVYSRSGDEIRASLRAPTPRHDVLIEGATPASPGDHRSWLESWFPLPTDDDAGRIAIIVRDVTEERRLARALHDADRRKDEFMATLAHELRNPLAPLANCLALLATVQHPLVDTTRGVLERQIHQLTRLVSDLMDASRVRTGKLEYVWTNVDLADVLQQVVAASAAHFDARRQHCVLRLPGGPVGLRGDAMRLSQLFTNLLNNASKFSPEGSTVTLELALTGDEAVVSVRDCGIGIPRERLEQVFQRFAQGDAPRELRAQGLGIGLWLAREIAERHDGSIAAASDGAGLGSTFEVRLPLRQKP